MQTRDYTKKDNTKKDNVSRDTLTAGLWSMLLPGDERWSNMLKFLGVDS